VVDISRYFDRRYRAILAYHSQFSLRANQEIKGGYPLDRLHRDVNLIARYYGQMAGVEICRTIPGEGSDAGGRRYDATGAVGVEGDIPAARAESPTRHSTAKSA